MIKRIAVLSVHTCPLATLGGKETGGMNVYVRDLSRELSRRGIYADVYTRSQNPDVERVVHLADRARVIHVKAGPERPYNKNQVLYHLNEFIAGVKAQVEADNVEYDLIYSHYWLSGLAAAALREVWDIPVVQMFHTLAEMKNRVAQTPAERETDQRTNCEGEIMHFADRLIAATPLEKNQMTWLYGADPDKIMIVPPGVDLNLFKPVPGFRSRDYIGVPSDHHMILFVGRVQPLKGIDTLLEALALAKQREPNIAKNICLSIIGGDSNPDSEIEQAEFERLDSLRAKLGISDLVTFLGAKQQDTLAYYYSAAEMVVMPSHYESFGMVAIEAMACGTPVIASNVGGLSFSIEDGFNGYLVPGGDPKLMADKIILLLKHRPLRDQLGEQARAWVARYNWVDIAEELLDIFEQVVEQHQNKERKRLGLAR
jgi:D-inositol-3-phosphate glycosyltransferase